AAAVSLDREATGAPKPKKASARRLVGSAVARTDIAGKIGGARSFVHDLVFAGMLHGRVVRPPSPGAVLLEVPAVGGVVAVVRDGTFLGVIAEREETAVAAASTLQAESRWEEHDTLPDDGALSEFLQGGRIDTTVV